MYHFIYKTTDLRTNKYYVGMHSTNNLEDGYMGSGNRIKWLLKRYGKENFKFEILKHYPSREALKEGERKIVTKELLRDSLCLNLKEGGEGGWTSTAKIKFKAKMLTRKYQSAFKKSK
jgi:hypothetical protein